LEALFSQARAGGELRVGRHEARQLVRAEDVGRIVAVLLGAPAHAGTYVVVAPPLARLADVAERIVALVGRGEVVLEDDEPSPRFDVAPTEDAFGPLGEPDLDLVLRELAQRELIPAPAPRRGG
jgi:uncharacterized protein YbjT (DUF2867 family)